MINQWLFRVTAGILGALVILFASSCGPAEREPGRISVVVTLSFLEDMVRQVGGEHVDVTALVPIGMEPENYEPTPGDVRAISEADVFIYNGYNLERWLPQLADHLDHINHTVALAEHPSIETIPLPDGPYAGEPDPHVWTDAANAKVFAGQIAAILGEASPGSYDNFDRRAAEYQEELNQLDEWIRLRVEKVPPEQRILVTSELCFQYYAAAYGFEHHAIWAINAPEEGTPSQIAGVVDLVRSRRVAAVFVENQVDARPMEQVSRETGIPIGGVLYSDSLSFPGEGGETYVDMMRTNTSRIAGALSGEESDSESGR